MADFTQIFIILTLLAVIIVQAVERLFYSKHMQEEQSKLIKAVMSKDVKEYTEAVKAEKDTPPNIIVDDEVELSSSDDDTFLKHIRN